MARNSVFYAIDDNPLYLYMVQRSVQSLRKFNSGIPVKLVLFGKCSPRDQRLFRKSDVELIVQPGVSRELGCFLKWMALQKVAQDGPQLFLDADTHVFGDVERLFKTHRAVDFAARRELGTHPDWLKSMAGTYLVRPQMLHDVFSKVCRQLGSKPRPIFNTGVMVMSGRFQKIFAENYRSFEEIRCGFSESKLLYPSRNPHILDEVVCSLFLGQYPSLKHAMISMQESPWYVEWKGGAVKKPGIVLHTFSEFYPFFIRDLDGAAALKRAPLKGLVEPVYLG